MSVVGTRTLAVLQPSYLPWLGYFDQMRRASVFVLYDDVQFDKHGWRNRNRIKTHAGPQWLTVPVLLHGQNRPRINEVSVDRSAPWRRKHLGSVQQAYAHAPYLREYLPALADALGRDPERLIDLNVALLKLLAGWLGVSTPVVLSSELGIHGERSERLIALCRHFGAGRYLSGAAARDYLDVARFSEAGVEVHWQDYQHPVYPQQHGPFLSHLSALDLLLNCGPDSPRILEGIGVPQGDSGPRTE